MEVNIHRGIRSVPYGKGKGKVPFVPALRLCTGCTAHRGTRGITLPFLDHGTRRGWGVYVTPRPLFTPGKDSVPIVQEAGWVPGPVWTGEKNLVLIGIRYPDRPARSQLLYRLSYRAHNQRNYTVIYITLQNVISSFAWKYRTGKTSDTNVK